MKISSPEDVVTYYNAQLKYKQKECILLLILDSKNRILWEELLSLGTIQTSIADPREIFLSALRKNGVSIILIHNHPNGTPYPSDDDQRFSTYLRNMLANFDINLIDHIIVSGRYYRPVFEGEVCDCTL